MHKIKIDKLPEDIEIWKYVNKHLNKKNLDVCFEYKSIFKNTKNIRVFVEKIVSNLLIDKTWIPRLILITDELNNNAIEHWSIDWDNNYMKFIIKHDKSEVNIKIEVEDSWKWENHKCAEEMYNMREDKLSIWFEKYRAIRWRGLFLIINKLVDELYFKDSKKWGLIVWIDKKIKIDNWNI